MLTMGEGQDVRRDAPREASLGRWARFLIGVAIGVAALVLAVTIASRLGDGGLLVLGTCLALGGLISASSRGFAMLLGVWLGVPCPVLVLAIAAGPACFSTPFPVPGCPQGFGFVLAGALLVGGLLVEGAGFLVGRLVRWAITGP
jgi:hypothetical protein